MQIQAVVDRNVASPQRVGLAPVEPGNRTDLDTAGSPGGACLRCPFSAGRALAHRRVVTHPDDRVLDQAASPRKTRYASHPLLEIVLFRLVPVVRPSLGHVPWHGGSTILMDHGFCVVVPCNVTSCPLLNAGWHRGGGGDRALY